MRSAHHALKRLVQPALERGQHAPGLLDAGYQVRSIKIDGWHVVKPKKDNVLQDKVYVVAKGGQGGSGSSAQMRPRPGQIMADGGDGGRGGNVILQADASIANNFSNVARRLDAGSGAPGLAQNVTGARGADLVVKVPVGTTVKLLDKVFARQPQLKPPFLLERVSSLDPNFTPGVDALPAAPVDTTVSEDWAEREHLFERHRRREAELGISTWNALGLDVLSDDPVKQRRQIKVRDDSALVVADLASHGDAVTVARGGRGGAGNKHFLSKLWGPASRWSEAGGSPESATLLLELKLLADVALVGFPNAGKSSLLRALTRAEPRVAPYAFTTLHPQLGVLRGQAEGGGESKGGVTVADMPGLIEGAHADRGLGHDFLRHIERTRVLAYVIDVSRGVMVSQPGARGARGELAGKASGGEKAAARFDMATPAEQFWQLFEEVKLHNAATAARPAVIVLNKVDCVAGGGSAEQEQFMRDAFGDGGEGTKLARSAAARELPPVVLTSAAKGTGLPELRRILQALCGEEETDKQGEEKQAWPRAQQGGQL